MAASVVSTEICVEKNKFAEANTYRLYGYSNIVWGARILNGMFGVGDFTEEMGGKGFRVM